ncbi:MAG: hypothetical protein V4709_16180 [Pseudomonadota bacterium]
MIYDYAPRLAARARQRQRQRRQFCLVLAALMMTSLSFSPALPLAHAAPPPAMQR